MRNTHKTKDRTLHITSDHQKVSTVTDKIKTKRINNNKKQTKYKQEKERKKDRQKERKKERIQNQQTTK